jgi:hypothetical protein
MSGKLSRPLVRGATAYGPKSAQAAGLNPFLILNFSFIQLNNIRNSYRIPKFREIIKTTEKYNINFVGIHGKRSTQ